MYTICVLMLSLWRPVIYLRKVSFNVLTILKTNVKFCLKNTNKTAWLRLYNLAGTEWELPVEDALASKHLKVKWSSYRPGVSQTVGRGIALLFHDLGTRRGEWSAAHPGRTLPPVPILQEAGWAPGPVWMGGKSRPHLDSIPDRPTHSQSLYRLSQQAPHRNM